MLSFEPRFMIGQLIVHRVYGYRGVIFDVDETFQGTEEWYAFMCKTSRPSKTRPWYSVLVHERGYETYVAERNLLLDASGEPVDHADIERHFEGLKDGYYVLRGLVH